MAGPATGAGQRSGQRDLRKPPAVEVGDEAGERPVDVLEQSRGTQFVDQAGTHADGSAARGPPAKQASRAAMQASLGRSKWMPRSIPPCGSTPRRKR